MQCAARCPARHGVAAQSHCATVVPQPQAATSTQVAISVVDSGGDGLGDTVLILVGGQHSTQSLQRPPACSVRSHCRLWLPGRGTWAEWSCAHRHVRDRCRSSRHDARQHANARCIRRDCERVRRAAGARGIVRATFRSALMSTPACLRGIALWQPKIASHLSQLQRSALGDGARARFGAIRTTAGGGSSVQLLGRARNGVHRARSECDDLCARGRGVRCTAARLRGSPAPAEASQCNPKQKRSEAKALLACRFAVCGGTGPSVRRSMSTL